MGAMQADLFVTCLIDAFFPDVGESVVRVLRRAGVELGFPAGQTCCGQPFFNTGYRHAARRQARRTLEVLEARTAAVIIPSGSCAAMIRHGYLELFRNDTAALERARRLADRTFEFSEFLVNVLGWEPPPRESGSLAYHAGCHLQRGLGVESAPRRLLESLCRTTVPALDPECCGFGGAFAAEHADISSAMLARRLEQISSCGAAHIVANDVGCLMHLEGGLRRCGSNVRCLHLAQVLDGRAEGLA
jgi:L-lactate dehydrogenase complex protein LldE